MNKRTFSQLKKSAKDTLSGRYWSSFATYMLYNIIVGAASYVVSLLLMVPFIFIMTSSAVAMSYSTFSQESIDAMITILAAILPFITLIPVYLFAQYPLYTGMTRHFVNATKGESNVMDLFSVYKNNLGNVIKISFLRSLYIFLWTLLFWVPGIIKTYQYSMMEYILAENPAIDSKRAFEVCKELTKGNKFRIFLFGLSFIGWILLSLLTFGIGLYFLYPYIYASMTQLYIDLRENALAEGRVSPEDFAY